MIVLQLEDSLRNRSEAQISSYSEKIFSRKNSMIYGPTITVLQSQKTYGARLEQKKITSIYFP
jgi:hypothetical protein